MTKHENPINFHIILLYILIVITLTMSFVAITTVTKPQESNFLNESNIEWRCINPICVEYEEISGEEWAQENCFITTEGTICTGLLEDGRQFQATLEELRQELDLNTITATKCLKYTCTEETPYRINKYTSET